MIVYETVKGVEVIVKETILPSFSLRKGKGNTMKRKSTVAKTHVLCLHTTQYTRI